MLAIRSPCSVVIVEWPLCRDGSPVTMKVEALLRATTRVWTLTLPYFVLRQFGMRSVRERNSSGSGRATTEWGLTGRSTTEDISEVLGLVPEAVSALLTVLPRNPLAARGTEPSPLVREPHYLRSEEHTSELQSLAYLVCRLLLEKK